MSTKYVVITPVRDEEAHLRLTAESMIAQSVRPTQWVIVNDGSTDHTGSITNDLAARHSWIRAVHRTNRGFRKAGGGVVEAFNDGYRALCSWDWDFIVKFDGDLSFEPDYFERCWQHFEADCDLGIGGGLVCNVVDGAELPEECPAFHVRGATKIYRKACWEAIGGLWPAPGWDTMDEVKANRCGWTTRSFPELHLIHHRQTGAADGPWRNWVKNGRANYICGYHPLFMLGKCLRRLSMRPYFVGAAGLMYGFFSGYFLAVPQVDDPDTIRYLRAQQLGRLFGGKSIWR